MTDKNSDELLLRSAILESGQSPNQKDKKLASLEVQLVDIKNQLHEERFVWIAIFLVIIDSIIFMDMRNWTGPIVIGIIEIIVLYVLSVRYEIEAVAPFIDRIFGFIHRVAKTEKD